MRTGLGTLSLLVALLAAQPTTAAGQHEGHHAMAPDSVRAGTRARHVMAQIIPLVTGVTATGGRDRRTQGVLSQPVIMARDAWWRGALTLEATLNGEGVTMRGGELSTGAFGEGYVDRRHPHTYLHELMLGTRRDAGPLALSMALGRGFAPFGTDDPMMRPFEKYPVNHHLAQVLERIQLVGAVRAGPVVVEGGTFAGDEPVAPASRPSWRRFGDSWSLRGTALPMAGAELQASYARVASPEEPGGFGLDQRKQSLSARAGARYLLAEWAHTAEWDHSRGTEAFAYSSALAEGALHTGRLGVSLRLEQTERPEEERLEDPFRTARPATDLAISGLTRWRSVTLGLATASLTSGRLRGYPFLEVERLAVRAVDPRAVFSVDRFYSDDRFWMVTAGVRLRAGAPHSRMGRYGAALPPGPSIATLDPGAAALHSH